MRHRSLLVLALLIYLTLDLSLPAMPGAFVFEPADSAESIRVRPRAAAETVALPALARAPGVVLFGAALEVDERRTAASLVERPRRPVVPWQSRAQYDAAPPSEDPH